MTIDPAEDFRRRDERYRRWQFARAVEGDPLLMDGEEARWRVIEQNEEIRALRWAARRRLLAALAAGLLIGRLTA